MSCGRKLSGSFSELPDTWSRKSDLRESSWDPLPGLREGYQSCCSPPYAQAGQLGATGKDHGPTTWYKGAMTSYTPHYKENYSNQSTLHDYVDLDQTWKVQKRYSL